MENIFGCENVAGKQKFLLKHVHRHPWGESYDSCLFKNIMGLHKDGAECAAHKKSCIVKDGAEGPVLVSAGFSCKTLSPLNNNRKAEAAQSVEKMLRP